MRGFSPAARAGLEDLARFVRREHAGLAEHVAPLGEPLARDRRNHLVDDRDRRRRARRSRYSTGTSCAPMKVGDSSIGVRRRRARASPAASSARPRWSARSRSWPRRSSCRSAASRRGGRACRRPARSSDAARVATHAADDAAAVGGDLGVGGAGQPPAQLVAAVAGEDDVGVRIDEAGHDGAAAGVDDDGVGGQRAVAPPVGFVADEDDRAAVRGDHGVRPRAGVGLARADARRRPGAGQDLGVLWIRKSATTVQRV